MTECSSKDPANIDVGDGHEIQCHLFDEEIVDSSGANATEPTGEHQRLFDQLEL